MPDIYPQISREELAESARRTANGEGLAPLPGVQTDVKHVNATDKCANEANRELADMIAKAMEAMKARDEHGEHFVLGWRLYPNKEHPRWQKQDEHACGCGCGCSA